MPKLLDDIVLAKGSEIAIADEYGRTTWQELDNRVRRLINGLKDSGIKPGDTIAMMMGNRRECFEIFQAAAHLGVRRGAADETLLLQVSSFFSILCLDL